MSTQMVITDLTRMYRGMVCVAGYDKDRRGIRLILPPAGIPERSLESNGQPVIFPFSVIELDLLQSIPQPPHTEDTYFDPQSLHYIRSVAGREKVLSWSLFENVATIFEQPIQTDLGFYVKKCQGPRSLGTIIPQDIAQVIYSSGEEGIWDYRLIFSDQAGEVYRLKINDLTWHYYCDSLRSPDTEPAAIAEKLTQTLRERKVYLRIGLARGWKEFPDRCYLQITGIYTFPDYLNGKTFLDFRSRSIQENLVSYEVDGSREAELSMVMDNDLRDHHLD